MILIFLSGEDSAVERLIQTAKGVRTDFANQAPDAVVEEQIQNLSQFLLVDLACFEIIKDPEQEQIHGRLVQSAKAKQCIVDLLAQALIAVEENMMQ